MDDNATDLGNVLNDSQPTNPAPAPAPANVEPTDQGEQQAAPPAAKPEPDLVPRAALMDERRKRQELEQLVEQSKKVTTPLKADDFESHEAYLEHLVERKADERFALLQQQQEATQRQAAASAQANDDLAGLMSAGAAKYQDFQTLVGSESLPISEAMMNAMLAVDAGHDVAYHLGKNPAEAARIAGLAPTSQARAIGQLAKQLATPAPASAPLPQTLTTTRSTDGRFASAQAWDGPSPLNDILGKRN